MDINELGSRLIKENKDTVNKNACMSAIISHCCSKNNIKLLKQIGINKNDNRFLSWRNGQ